MVGKKRGRPPKERPEIGFISVECIVDNVSTGLGHIKKGEKASVSRDVAEFLAGRNQVRIIERKDYDYD